MALKKAVSQALPQKGFIGPVLPTDPEALCKKILPYVDHVLIRWHYKKIEGLFR